MYLFTSQAHAHTHNQPEQSSEVGGAVYCCVARQSAYSRAVNQDDCVRPQLGMGLAGRQGRVGEATDRGGRKT